MQGRSKERASTTLELVTMAALVTSVDLQSWRPMRSACAIERGLEAAGDQILSNVTKRGFHPTLQGGRPHNAALLACWQPLPKGSRLHQSRQMQIRNSSGLFFKVGSIFCSERTRQGVCKQRKGPPWLTGTRKRIRRKPLDSARAVAESGESEASLDNGNEDNGERRRWQDWLGLATSLYPVYVSLGAILAVVRPSSFAWFCAVSGQSDCLTFQ